MSTPTKPGWYRARWPACSDWSCVLVESQHGRLVVISYGAAISFDHVAEWGLSIDTMEEDFFAMVEIADVYQAEIASLRAALQKISDIRDSIVGAQTVNWSEHVYPLVAALNSAGFAGADFADARSRIGTLVERCRIAEARACSMVDEISSLRAFLFEAACLLGCEADDLLECDEDVPGALKSVIIELHALRGRDVDSAKEIASLRAERDDALRDAAELGAHRGGFFDAACLLTRDLEAEVERLTAELAAVKEPTP